MLHCISAGSRLAEHGVLALHHHTQLFGRLLVPCRAVLVLVLVLILVLTTVPTHEPNSHSVSPPPQAGSRGEVLLLLGGTHRCLLVLQEGVRSTSGYGGC